MYVQITEKHLWVANRFKNSTSLVVMEAMIYYFPVIPLTRPLELWQHHGWVKIENSTVTYSGGRLQLWSRFGEQLSNSWCNWRLFIPYDPAIFLIVLFILKTAISVQSAICRNKYIADLVAIEKNWKPQTGMLIIKMCWIQTI